MELFKITELEILPEVLQKFIIDGYEIYYKIDDPSQRFRFLVVQIKIDGEIVANADFESNDNEGNCQNIEVNQEYRRKGIATALYVFAEHMFGCALENF